MDKLKLRWTYIYILSALCSMFTVKTRGVLERTTHYCVAPIQGKAFGEEHYIAKSFSYKLSH